MTRTIILLLTMACCLTGCGQTGPLYLPGHKPPVYVPRPHPHAPVVTTTTQQPTGN